MNHSYGDDNFIVVWSNKMKCNITDLEYHNNVMQQVAIHVIESKSESKREKRERERERERETERER